MIRSTVVVLVLAGSTQASVLYGTSGYNGPGNLMAINQTTGQASLVGGGLGVTDVGDLTSNSITGQMWGVRITDNQLIDINPVTGLATGFVNMNSPDDIVSIAYSNASGKLYGNTSVSYGAPFEALYEINPATGNCVFVGRIVFDNVYGLAFANDGTLYGISDFSDQLITISTVTGNGALVAGVPGAGYFDLAARPEDGVMFVSEAISANLYTINLGNGALTLVGPYNAPDTSNMVGLAFVPAPGAAALLGLGAIVAGCRRR